MVTVPASELVAAITDRMPAILEDADWAAWLGEVPTTPAEAKSVLKTMQGVNWRMEREAKPTKPPPKRKPANATCSSSTTTTASAPCSRNTWPGRAFA